MDVWMMNDPDLPELKPRRRGWDGVTAGGQVNLLFQVLIR